MSISDADRVRVLRQSILVGRPCTPHVPCDIKVALIFMDNWFVDGESVLLTEGAEDDCHEIYGGATLLRRGAVAALRSHACSPMT